MMFEATGHKAIRWLSRGSKTVDRKKDRRCNWKRGTSYMTPSENSLLVKFYQYLTESTRGAVASEAA